MTGAAEWEGPVGSVWASEYIRTDRSFAELSAYLDRAIRDAAPATGTALDIGCGAGSTSFALAAANPNLAITGLDIAPELIQVANDRAQGFAHIRFAVADLNAGLPDIAPPDLLFSRHGVMFFDDPAKVFARLHDAANPGAPLVFSCFRSPSLNPWAGQLAATILGQPPAPPTGYAPSPFAFADAAFVKALLQDAGWQNVTAEPVDYNYIAGESADPVADALGFFQRIGPVASALKMLQPVDRPGALEKIVPILEQHRDGDRILFPAAAWIWRAAA
ncbi:Putative methyltransferase YcgJ [Sphingomonas antarctica]|uniref:class I SAM-dependent methyltransferase n=1 Tax=Sphingomonas antarctica TaxID=2040274 RepID=UPI0039EB2533